MDVDSLLTDAFPRLSKSEIDSVRAFATERRCADGQLVFDAGDVDVPFNVVLSGGVEIVNAASNTRIVTHGPGECVGDIDILTGRAVIVRAVAVGDTTLLAVPADQFRSLLSSVPRLSEKLIVAFQLRRESLAQSSMVGIKVVGPRRDAPTQLLRELLTKNFVPFTWCDVDADSGKRELHRAKKSRDDLPLVIAPDETVLSKPSIRDVAKLAGIRRRCPEGTFDLAVIGAGPAGLSAAVYAASEGLRTIVVDALGPGGQAGGTSSIENFLGYPSGLSGVELAERGVLQMLKFGATLLAPARVERLDFASDNADHLLHLDGNDHVRARTILVATGAKWRRLDADNVERFEGGSVYYAATLNESRLCTGQRVAVIGGGNSAGQAAMFLSECSEVELIVRENEFGGHMSEYLKQRIENCDRIRVRTRSCVRALHGEQKLEAIDIATVDAPNGKTERVDVQALFVFIGAEPNADWLPRSVARDKDGYVCVGPEAKATGRWPLKREPLALETTAPRVLSAGDVRCGATKRVGFAVGDGALAVTCTHRLRAMG
ncbi:MAG: FAD-dependent oxidoreductase [Tepidisphaeraceae bacterium]